MKLRTVLSTALLFTTITLSARLSVKVASSDPSRSNWCPGSDVAPQEVKLDNISADKHTLTVNIPKAQRRCKKNLNH